MDFVGDNRVIFDLGGNKYRLIVHVSFEFGRVLVKFIGTHALARTEVAHPTRFERVIFAFGG